MTASSGGQENHHNVCVCVHACAYMHVSTGASGDRKPQCCGKGVKRQAWVSRMGRLADEVVRTSCDGLRTELSSFKGGPLTMIFKGVRHVL